MEREGGILAEGGSSRGGKEGIKGDGVVWEGREKLIWIIGPEAQDNVPHRPYHEGVPSHRHRWECLVGYVDAGIFL